MTRTPTGRGRGGAGQPTHPRFPKDTPHPRVGQPINKLQCAGGDDEISSPSSALHREGVGIRGGNFMGGGGDLSFACSVHCHHRGVVYTTALMIQETLSCQSLAYTPRCVCRKDI